MKLLRCGFTDVASFVTLFLRGVGRLGWVAHGGHGPSRIGTGHPPVANWLIYMWQGSNSWALVGAGPAVWFRPGVTRCCAVGLDTWRMGGVRDRITHEESGRGPGGREEGRP